MKINLYFLLPLLLCACGKKLDKNEPLASNFFQQASLESQHGNPKKALNLVNKSIEHKKTPQAMLLKATLLYTIGSTEESIVLYEQIIHDKKTPRAMASDAKNNYASALYKLGKTQRAQELWEELCIDQDYLSPELAYFNLGIAHFKHALKQTESESAYNQSLKEAEQNLRQAITISKYYIDALFFLAQIKIRQNKLEEARDILLDVLVESPEHALAEDLLHRLESQVGTKPIEKKDSRRLYEH